VPFEPADIFLTGATGFVGSHVLAALLASGRTVRALVRPGSILPLREGCRPVVGDLLRPGELVPALRGCRYLIHTAALYSFSPGDREKMHDVNVRGTTGLLVAARLAGVERAVVTSSSATVGPARGPRPATEADFAPAAEFSPYHHSKVEQEHAALAARVPTILLLPTAPVGPGDWRPTPTGQMIVDFMKGRIFGTLPGGLNLVAVEDVAAAHVRALEAGTPRERYLIGGENLTLAALWQELAAICGRTAPTRPVPYSLAMAFARADDLLTRVRSGRRPLAPPEGVRMGRLTMFVDDARARRELAHDPSPVRRALERAVRWYGDNGYA
jgi:dihydroflavonol-4-reductase